MPVSFELPKRLPLGEQQGQTLPYLVELMRALLGPAGCPWDREQSKQSLRRYVLEEACEVMDAIDANDDAALVEELGDLALQIVFQAELARQSQAFGPDDAIFAICEKLVRRHPHVFGEATVRDSAEVIEAWERGKIAEKGPKRLLDGIPRSLPSLMRAQQLSDRAARVGFDWPDATSSRAKVDEELAELDQAVAQADRAEIASELGDVLFALVNLARQYGLDAEELLRATSDKFGSRFADVEGFVAEERGGWPRDERGKPTTGLSLEVLDQYWVRAKGLERARQGGPR